ncbi:hypothetical protein [Streptomyces sp. NPDC007100]|uniref:hypothetical protein n=1 Tax=Streptomyces sp. NPDC007100 TaxID=3155602 RepID=UPI0033FE7C10
MARQGRRRRSAVRRGAVAKTDYLSGVEAGTEACTGKAQLDTAAYSADVGRAAGSRAAGRFAIRRDQ